MTAIAHAGYMTGRHLRALARQPWYIAFTLLQPLVYLLIFGALFEKASLIPGFGSDSYITFLTPGVLVMSALFTAVWNGMDILEDMKRGTLDRFLVTPVWRGALIAGPIANAAVSSLVQAAVIFGVGSLLGAHYEGGIAGVAVLIVASLLLTAPFAAFSNAVALTARQEETMIGLANFVALPLTFLASGFIPLDLAPNWIQTVARFNPVNWALKAGREALSAAPDWGLIGIRLGSLVVVGAVLFTLATSAFRSYQRSI